MKPVRFIREAEAEYAAAALSYDERSPDAAVRFMKDIAATARGLRELAHRHPHIPVPGVQATVRRARLRRFPYGLVFMDLDDRIVVLAVAHIRRRPLYWVGRLAPEEEG